MSILGEFGTGKTWFTLRLASDRLQAYRAARKARKPRGRYPLLIQLRDYAKAVSVESLLSEFFFDRFEVGLPSMKAFRVLNRMRRFLLIFDGFDEMARKVDYQKVVDNFWELAKVVVPGAKAVLTCRDEHFRHTQEAREVFAGHEMATTAKIVLVPPRFEVVHLEPFDEPRIRQAIVARQGNKEGSKTADLILSHKGLADLGKRPVMIDMVLQSLDDIKDRDSIVTSQVYLFATDAQMRKNIKEERTFTSMTEKVLFLCELAWEMHRTQNLRINYKLFPERFLEIFGDRVTETEKDHWWFDLMGQTLLVRDADGNYSFAHRGLVEYFAAYRLLAQVDALAPEFFERYQDEGASPAEALRERPHGDRRASWGEVPMHPNLVAFLAEMASGKDALLRLIDWTKGKGEDEVGYVGGNAATVLARIDAEALEGADLSGVSLRQAKLPGARLRGTKAAGADLREADLMAADVTTANFRKAKLEGTRLAGLRCHAALACSDSGDVLFGGPQKGGWVYDVPRRKFLDVYGEVEEGFWDCNRAVSADGSWLAHAYLTEVRVGRVDREAGLVRWEKTEKPRLGDGPGVAWHPGAWFLVIGPDWVFRVGQGLPVSIRELEPLPIRIQDRAGIAIRPPWWAVGGARGTTVWHEETRRVVAELNARAFCGERPEFSPTGARLSIANARGLFIFDTADWSEVGHVEGDSEWCVHGWSPTGAQVAFCAGPEVLVVESADLSVSLRFSLPAGLARGVAFHGPNELVVLDGAGTVHLYALNMKKLIHSSHQVPLCEGADFRWATGLDAATSAALKGAGAKVGEIRKRRARTRKAVRKAR